MKKCLQDIVAKYYTQSSDASYDWAGRLTAELRPRRLLDIGCGDGSRLFRYLQNKPDRFCGVEGHPQLADQARKRGIDICVFDLNGVWQLESNCFDVVHASQVIEHVHNTRQFLAETYRVLVPGGHAVITSENLASFLNLSAMLLGYTPFSLQPVCGWYLGNPFGLHNRQDTAIDLSCLTPGLPEFSGIAGHNRVLTVPLARDLLDKTGFVRSDVRSVGLMPLPGWMGRPLERLMPRRGHFLLLHATKPL